MSRDPLADFNAERERRLQNAAPQEGDDIGDRPWRQGAESRHAFCGPPLPDDRAQHASIPILIHKRIAHQTRRLVGALGLRAMAK